MSRSGANVLLVVSGLGCMIPLIMISSFFFDGQNDFAPFYIGANLVGTDHLYDGNKNREVALEKIGHTAETWRYIRPPFHAAFLWPLAQLEYPTAYVVWICLLAAALGAYLTIWRIPSRSESIVFTAWNMPLFASFLVAQDVVLLLLIISLGIYWESRQKPIAAGLVLSLCAAKFHLFVLLPLLMLAQRRVSMLVAFGTGGLGLAALSFFAGGADWPLQAYRAATSEAVSPGGRTMPNLHGMLIGMPGGAWWEVLFTVIIIWLAWLAFQRVYFAEGLAVATVGGLLISHHAYIYDCALLLPAILVLRCQAIQTWVRALGLFLLSPPFVFLISHDRPWSQMAQGTLALFFLGIAVPHAVALRRVFRSTLDLQKPEEC